MLRPLQRAEAVLFALLAVLPYCTPADVAASTFYIAETQTQFSLNIPNANNTTTNDVYIYFTSQAYSWVAVGFGAEMKNSLSFVMYTSSDGNNVTISPRIGTGHSEPSFTKDCTVETLNGTGTISGTDNDMFVLRAVARNCRVWPGGAIDLNSSAYPMIYAFGSGQDIESDSVDYPLKRHSRYGKFTMDMKQATGGDGEVPPPSQTISGVTLEGGMTQDHDRAKLAHAVLGCMAIFVLWPLNVLCAGFLKRIKIHVGMSVLLIVFLIVAYGLGISASMEYNRSKHFNSAHQIIAFISIFPILLLSLLPIPSIAVLSRRIPQLHTPLSAITFSILALCGGFGLRLGSQGRPVIFAYSAISILVFVFIVSIQACIRRRGSAFARSNGRRRIEENDEQDLVLAAYHANMKLENESMTGSASSVSRSQHERNVSGGSATNIYGGGTMPGPQYMLNMHPGVPIHYG